MQVPDIATAVSPEKPYVYKGLSVQGVSPYRLTPVANPDIKLTPEFREQLIRKNLVRLFIESKTAIAAVGRGLRPAAPTVRAHVRVVLITSGLVQRAVNLQARELLTQKAAPPSDIEVDLSNPQLTAYKFGRDGAALNEYSRVGSEAWGEPDEVIEDLSDLNEDMDVEF